MLDLPEQQNAAIWALRIVASSGKRARRTPALSFVKARSARQFSPEICDFYVNTFHICPPAPERSCALLRRKRIMR
jgi:hypothetical protein